MPSKFGGIPVEDAKPSGSKFGGVPVDEAPAAPGPPKPPVPDALTGTADLPDAQDPVTQWLDKNAPFVSSPHGFFRSGARQVASAAEPGKTWQNRASDVMEGGSKIATPFMIPSMVANPISSVVGFGAGMAGQKGTEAAARALGASPDTERLVGNVGGVALGPVLSKGLGKLSQLGGRDLYRSALKPRIGSDKVSIQQANEMVDTGVTRRARVSEGGFNKLNTRIGDLNSQVTQHLQNHQNPYAIDPLKVAKTADPLMEHFNGVNPETPQSQISGSQAEYLRKHSAPAPFQPVAPQRNAFTGQTTFQPNGPVAENPQPISYSPMQAQLEKQATYRALDNSYGEQAGANVETQKALARGLRGQISETTPAVGPLNAEEAKLIPLKEEIGHRVKMAGNREMATFSPFHTVARALEAPAIKSSAGIAMDMFGRPLATGSGTTAARYLPLTTRKLRDNQ